MQRHVLTFCRRVLRGLLTVLAALWMILEEWIWDSLARLMAWIGRLPPVRWLETRLSRLSPNAAMVVFTVPWCLLLPAKLLAFCLIGSGHAPLGMGVLLLAKVLGTALLARLFSLTRPALLQIGWFRRLYHWFTGWRDRLYAYVKSLRAWRAARAAVTRVRATVRGWLRRPTN